MQVCPDRRAWVEGTSEVIEIMPVILEETEIDPIAEEVDLVMTRAEEEEANRRFAPAADPGDLSDGGMVGGARLTPMSAGRKLVRGRAAARRAWMWNGTESLIPLAWNPDGTHHDRGMRYLLKRHCLCCGKGGFHGAQCPNCVKSGCTTCRGSTNRTKIIPCFYLRQEDVPFPAKFYGNIPCFLTSCIRQGDRGFLTDQDMRLHARTRHRMEYQAHMEALEAGKQDEVADLRRRLDAMIGNYGQVPVAVAVSDITEVKTAVTEVPIARVKKPKRTAKKAKRRIAKPVMA